MFRLVAFIGLCDSLSGILSYYFDDALKKPLRKRGTTKYNNPTANPKPAT